jgi:hypothetical protein
MYTIIKGMIKIDSLEIMESLSEIVNDTSKYEGQHVVNEEEDYIEIDDIDIKCLSELLKQGFLTETEFTAASQVDLIKFYLD